MSIAFVLPVLSSPSAYLPAGLRLRDQIPFFKSRKLQSIPDAAAA
jgi:hypothetical protein